MKNDLVLVVLAAGVGKRFWPFVTDKSAFPFAGHTMIDLTIPKPLPTGVTSVVIVANPHNKTALARIAFPVQVHVVVQEDASGMAGALVASRKYMQGKRILVMIADDLADTGLTQQMIKSAHPDVFGVLTAWKSASYFPGGYISFRDGRPVAIVEKPGEGKTPSEYVYFGGQYFQKADELLRILDSLNGKRDDLYEQALTMLMKDRRFELVQYEKDFVSLKYPWHVLDGLAYVFRHHFRPGQGRNVLIRNNVSIEGQVYLGNNVRIFENTKIVGPVYIGDNTVIGNNNIIRESHIGSDCVTGFNTDITRSHIGDGCWFHSNYIGDSVLEGDVSLGSGAVLANLRLDEGEIYSVVGGGKLNTKRKKLGAMIGKHVRIGSNASIMPGVKIGANSFVGAGVVLDGDLPDQSFCVMKRSYEVKRNKGSIHSDRAALKAKIQ